MAGKLVNMHNLGCKVNAYEAAACEAMLKDAGYVITDSENADICIINTCTVTAIADKKSRQMIHSAKKLNPDAVIVAMGCYVQVAEEDLEKDPDIDIIIGNNKKNELVPLLEKFFNDKERKSLFEDISKDREFEEQRIYDTGSTTRAFVKIQDGCDRFCSYCIIPYARGRIRSRDEENVISEVQLLAASGCKEIVLTGIHVSSYGADTKKENALLHLIEKLNAQDGIERIRLSSLEPGIITEDFVKGISSLEKVCPHFHLSLQSGCAATLKRMNRRYTPEEYAMKAELLREYFHRPALTTDVIAGFPGETEEEFRESYDFVESISFYETHIFPYSKRKGTAAASMPGQLSRAVKKQRVDALLALNERKKAEYLLSGKGEKAKVLFEECSIADGKKVWEGYTERYERVTLASEDDLKNRIIEVTL